jgi:hypothetical protein
MYHIHPALRHRHSLEIADLGGHYLRRLGIEVGGEEGLHRRLSSPDKGFSLVVSSAELQSKRLELEAVELPCR